MLVFNEISKSFGHKEVIKDISMEIDYKEIVGLLGVNGAGKTTIIKLIVDLLSPDKGDILLDGKKIKMEDINVLLSSQRGLQERLSGYENIFYFSALKGMFKKEVKLALEKYKKYDELLKQPINQLSLGQRQIVAVIMTIITEPKIILLDEPSNGLDINYKNEIVNIIKSEKEDKSKIILVTSHDLFFLSEIVDRFYIIHNGKLCDAFEKANNTAESIQERYESIIKEQVIK